MEEIQANKQKYRGYTIKYNMLKLNMLEDAHWFIYNSNKQQVGTSYKTPKEAKDYIDDILKP